MFNATDKAKKNVFIDQTPGLTQVKECLKSSSEDDDADSCRKHSYEYNYDAVDMLRECNQSLSSESSSSSVKQNKDSSDGEDESDADNNNISNNNNNNNNNKNNNNI